MNIQRLDRRLGLATIAITEGMKKTKALGATYCFGGVPEFYSAIGFETIYHREKWRKEWKSRRALTPQECQKRCDT